MLAMKFHVEIATRARTLSPFLLPSTFIYSFTFALNLPFSPLSSHLSPSFRFLYLIVPYLQPLKPNLKSQIWNMPNKRKNRAKGERPGQPQTTFRVMRGELVGISSKGVGTKEMTGKERGKDQYVQLWVSPPVLFSPASHSLEREELGFLSVLIWRA